MCGRYRCGRVEISFTIILVSNIDKVSALSRTAMSSRFEDHRIREGSVEAKY